MLFSTNTFLFLFLPVVLLGYQAVSRLGSRAVFLWLGLMSLVFYGYWNPKFLFLLLGSIALNFGASRLIAGSRTAERRSAWLTAAIVANLSLLFWFKYLFPLLHFALSAGWTGRDFGSVLLPLGISFFTFTQIAYLVDLSEGEEQPEDLISYTLFVTFFPHLVAGPIIHHAEMMPQFRAQRHRGLQADDMAVGTTWFLLGLAKKVLIADHFGPAADALYAQPRSFGAHASWIGVLCYAVQLYFDFSGYSDMALGLARMFSITFPFNFNSPYKAGSIIDFWQRWHMTLTRYITTYLYNPFAMAASRRRLQRGEKVGRRGMRTVGGFLGMIAWPTLLTMAVAGVWHGAGLQFILFGLAHGLYLTVNHLWRTALPEESRVRRLLPGPVSVSLTFACVLVGQVFFRSNSAGDAFWVLGSLLGMHRSGAGLAMLGRSLPAQASFAGHTGSAWAQVAIACGIFWLLPNTQEILGQVSSSGARSWVLSRLRWRPNLVWAAGLMLLTLVTLTKLYQSTSFLYFQF